MRLPASTNERSSWTARAREAEVAEHVEEVDDGVLLEDDGVVARRRPRQRSPWRAPWRPPRGRSRRRRSSCVDRRASRRSRCRRRVPSSTVRSWATVRVPRGTDALRVGDRDRLRAGRERAVGGDAGRVGGGDDLTHAVGSDSGLAPAVAVRSPASTSSAVVGLGQAAPVVELLHDPGDRARRCAARRRRPSSSVRPLEATPTRLPTTNRRFTTTLVSATFWWIWLLANRVSAASSAMTRASASVAPSRSAWRDGRSRRAAARRGRGRRSSAPRAHHLPTPTWTFRNRAPGTRVADVARPGRARPCRSWACRASRSCWRRRRRRTTARTRR